MAGLPVPSTMVAAEFVRPPVRRAAALATMFLGPAIALTGDVSRAV